MAHERKIGSDIYRFDELTGFDAWDALQLLLKIAGPFVPILSAVAEADDAKRTEALVKVIPDILRSHDPDAAKELFVSLVKNCRVGGMEAVIGVKPQTLDEMFQVFAFCLEHQFASFFGGAGVQAFLSLMADKKAA